MKSFAACGLHLNRALEYMHGIDPVIIRKITKPDPLFNCECRRPAIYFIYDARKM